MSTRGVLLPRPANASTPTRKRTRSTNPSKTEPAKTLLYDTPDTKTPTDVLHGSIKRPASRARFIDPRDTIRRKTEANETTTESNVKHAQWQLQYRNAFPKYAFYFDQVDHVTQARCVKSILHLHGRVEPFFSSSVTHVVTSRDFDSQVLQQISARAHDTEVKSNDTELQRGGHERVPNVSEKKADFSFAVPMLRPHHTLLHEDARRAELLPSRADVLVKAHDYDMKIWRIAKFINIINNIIGETGYQSRQNLSHLLKEEKVHGSTERDPSVRRDDHVYFSSPHVLVRDLSNTYRPIMVKEYARVKKDSDGTWPQIRHSGEGKCPFIADPKQRNVEKLRPRQSISRPVAPPPCHGQSRFVLNEIAASGMNMSNLTSNVRSQTSAATRSGNTAASSKELNMLKRKVLDRNKPMEMKEKLLNKDQRPSKPGFCENCRDKYDDFDEVSYLWDLVSYFLALQVEEASEICRGRLEFR